MSQRIFVSILFNHKNLINAVFLCQNTDTSSYFLLSMATPGITDHLWKVDLVSLGYLCEQVLLLLLKQR